MHLNKLTFFTAMLCVLFFGGCIPSEAPKEPDFPFQQNAEPQSAPVPQNVSDGVEGANMETALPASPPDAQPPAQVSRITGNMEHHELSAQDIGALVLDNPDGSGFIIKGSFGLEGTITRSSPEAAVWNLEAAFNFDKPGYVVEEPYVMQMMDILIGDGPAHFETEAGSYVITLPLIPPRPGAEAATEKKQPISTTIHAGAKPQFTIVLLVK